MNILFIVAESGRRSDKTCLSRSDFVMSLPGLRAGNFNTEEATMNLGLMTWKNLLSLKKGTDHGSDFCCGVVGARRFRGTIRRIWQNGNRRARLYIFIINDLRDAGR